MNHLSVLAAGSLAFAVAVMGATVAVHTGAGPLPDQEHPVVHPPDFSATVEYDESAETARLTFTGPEAIRNDRRTTVVSAVHVYAERPQDDQSRAPATIRADGTLREDGRWAATESPRVQSLPLETGTTVAVVSDGVDSDGDGTAGLEPGDTVAVWVAMGPEGRTTVTVYTRTVGNGS